MEQQIKPFYSLRPSLLQSIIFIAVGLVLIIWSASVLNFVVELIGATVVFLSTISVIRYFQLKKESPDIKRFPPIDSYISIIFGILLIMFPEFFISILMAIIGITAIVGGSIQFYSFYQIKKAGMDVNWVAYFSPSIMLLLGLLIITNPFGFANALLIILFGINSLIYGLTNLAKFITYK